MQELIQGIHRFHHHVFKPRRGHYERLARGQHPSALFITCSDSRIDPCLLTQSEPGDLFVLRNAGNLIPPHGVMTGEEATIEFAIKSLGIRDVIVCGHSDCGAVKGLLDPREVAEMPAVSRWLEFGRATRRIVLETYGHLDGRRLVMAAVQENVLVQIEHLCTLPAVSARLGRGDLRLHGWVYKIETGEVFAFDPEAGQFLPLRPDSRVPTVDPVARRGISRGDGRRADGERPRIASRRVPVERGAVRDDGRRDEEGGRDDG